MAQYQVRITRVVTNGPYCTLIVKDGAGFKDTNSIANIGAAIDGVKADIGADLGGQVVTSMNMSVNTT